MGVTIYKPGEKHPDEGLSFEERQLKARQERRARLDAHLAKDREYRREHLGEKAAPGPPDNKALPGPPENKAAVGPPEPQPLTRADLADKTKAELEALAVERGVDVARTDGRTDLGPRVSDYIAALAG